MANVVGSLRVLLGLDSAEFVQGLTRADRQAQAFAQRMRSELGGAVKSVASIVGGLAIGREIYENTKAIIMPLRPPRSPPTAMKRPVRSARNTVVFSMLLITLCPRSPGRGCPPARQVSVQNLADGWCTVNATDLPATTAPGRLFA